MIFTMLMFFKFLFAAAPVPDQNLPKSIYDFKVAGLEGGEIDFSKFKGKKILIVNTASKCGYTPQYGGLQDLYDKHKDKLVIIGFPSNDFMSQEPGSKEEIAEFCQRNYGVTFPMADKVAVIGKDMAPIYQWLTNKDYNRYQNSKVKWNFQKYLINEKGELVGVFFPNVDPKDPELLKALDVILTDKK